MKCETLREYIDRVHGGSQSAYARSINKSRQEVGRWVADGRIVADNKIYSYRRDIYESKL